METAHRNIAVGVSYMYEAAFNRALLPLLESGDVDALEWSFDTVADPRSLPDWVQGLLGSYAAADRLYGHGVYYSLLEGSQGPNQEQWLRRFEAVQQLFPFRHVSEHFGFMTSSHAHRGCPLPVPLTEETLAVGRRRLRALQAASGGLVGVENLALSFCREDVLSHGRFLEELVAPTGGFVVLDLHNVYCQSHNFGVPLRSLICSYPLDCVREIHLSGGSWSQTASSEKAIRRDTHDDAIPAEVLEALPFAVGNCENLDLVVVERLGDTFATLSDEAQFRDEFLQVKALVAGAAGNRAVPAWPFTGETGPVAGPDLSGPLAQQQQDILRVLATAQSAADVKSRLLRLSSLQDWRIPEWEPSMIETALELGRKWGIELAEEGRS